MEARKLERDLLKILKTKKMDEFFYVIMHMVNNTYNYEVEYINDIKYEKVIKSLEKIIIIGSDFNSFDSIECINAFAKNIENVKFQDIQNNSVRYTLYTLKYKLNKNRKIVAGFSLLVSMILLCNSLGMEIHTPKKSIENEIVNEEVIDPIIAKNDEIIVPEIDSSLIVVEDVMTEEESINYILDRYNLTKDEFDVLCAIVLAEAAPNSYDDAYAVINTIYNRIHSKMWNTIIEWKYEDKGSSLYYQAIYPEQFVVYQNGLYKEKIGVTDVIGYKAILDFLVTEETKHDYLCFRANNVKVDNSVKFTENGNNYFEPMKEEDRIIENNIKLGN